MKLGDIISFRGGLWVLSGCDGPFWFLKELSPHEGIPGCLVADFDQRSVGIRDDAEEFVTAKCVGHAHCYWVTGLHKGKKPE